MALSLRQWRLAKELTQSDVAAAMDISTPTYARWEQNPGDISLSEATRLIAYLKIDWNDIIFLPNQSIDLTTESTKSKDET